MRIISLTLFKYDRIGLSKLKKFHLDATAVQQIILGTNGWGKSSIMSELSPLPPNPEFFGLGGYKEIVIEDHGNIYKLFNRYDKVRMHAFIVNDGENLNVSRKETEQKSLVKEHFGLTQPLFDVLTGQLLFTDMPANLRRDWLMAMSGMDFSYLMTLHQNVKDKHREYTSLVKNLSQRETDETKKLGDLGNVAEISIAVQTLKEEITMIMQQKSNVDRSTFNEARVDKDLVHMERLAKDILELDLRYPRSLPALAEDQTHSELLGALKTELTYTEDKLSLSYARKEKIELVTRSISSTTQTLDDFRMRLERSQCDLKALLDQPTPFFIAGPSATNTATVEHLAQTLREIFLSYPDNRGLTFNSKRRDQLMRDQSHLTLVIGQTKEAIATAQGDCKHLESRPFVECPKCDLRWQPGIEPDSVANLHKQLDSLLDSLHKHEKELDEVNESLENFKEFIQIRGAILATLNRKEESIVMLASKFRELEASGCNNRMLGSLLGDWVTGMARSAEISKLEQEIEDDRTAIYHAEQIESFEMSDRVNQLSGLDQEISDLISRKQTLTIQIQTLGMYTRKITLALDLKRQLQDACNDLDYSLEKHIAGVRDFQLDAYLGRRQSELAVSDAKLVSINATIASIAAIGNFRDENLCKSNCTKELQDILSPTTGLIAECITQFMQDFVGDLNYVLSSVWSYDMVIYPCRTDGNLDYKFPIEFGNGSKIRSDIKQTSSAQQKVINLAFRLMVMTQIPNRIFPLYLDEIESAFDETHLTSLIRFIRGFIESGQCSQLFMISHDVGTHGAFPNAEYCVIGEENIVNLPPVYNKHVSLEYS